MNIPLHLPRFVAAHAKLAISAVVVLALGTGGMLLGLRPHAAASQGGMTVAVSQPKAAAELPATSAAAAARVKSSTPTSCSQNGAGKLLLVSITQQHLWACDGSSLANETAVTTGATQAPNGVDDATPTGTWHIYSKQTNRTLKGCDANGCWNDPVAYWMPFDGAVGFHDASWQTFPFGSSQYQTDGSHGCVHLPLDFIAWLYAWAPVGTTVTIKS